MNNKTKLTFLGLAVSAALMGCNPKENTEQTDSANSDTLAVNEETATVDANAGAANETVTINTVRGDVELAADPHPVVVYDMTLLQDLAALGVPVEGMPEIPHLDNVHAEGTPESKIMGTVFEPDMEALNAMQPKAILVGSRMAEKYDSLSQMAPTLDLTLDTANLYESSKQRLIDLGKLFNKTDKAAELQGDIDSAIEKAKVASEGKGNGLILMVNGNKISAYGDSSRFGFIHTLFGIPMADENIVDKQHGQPVSFEYVQKTNPDWLFVLDRSSAIGEEGKAAEEVLDNPLVQQTKAWKNKHIVYLSPDAYLAFGSYHQWIKDANSVAQALGKADSVN